MKIFLATVCFLLLAASCEIMPRNTRKDCRLQCEGSKKSKACYDFCDCIHREGKSLNECLEQYDAAAADTLAPR